MPPHPRPALPGGLRAVLAAAVLAAAPAAAGDEPLRIPQVEVLLAGREVRVTTELSPGLPSDVRKRLGSGLPTTVSWEVRLMVLRDKWWDGLRDERSYSITAAFRPESGDYAVERRIDGRLLETVVLPTRDEAEQALVRIPGIPCFTLGPGVAGVPLVVRVRAVYGTHMALGFVPVRTMTDWRRSPDFRWAEPGEAP